MHRLCPVLYGPRPRKTRHSQHKVSIPEPPAKLRSAHVLTNYGPYVAARIWRAVGLLEYCWTVVRNIVLYSRSGLSACY